ncbi:MULTISPECIES: transporter substrate-binding domain-containing protein [unclassified Pseudomonas]|uniref:transporter substrate-binding domain-containing protein n=1 Tax=unclassified Pseudomonas TaxID=196821 RepID=UPI0037F300D7
MDSLKRGLLSLALGASVTFFNTLAWADATWDKIQQRKEVSIGIIVTGLPFGTIDPKTREIVGYSADLAADIARRLNVKLNPVAVLAPNRVQFLQQGKVDMLVANMGLTPERAEILDYVPTPYESIGGALLTRKGSGIKRWEDVKGKNVCVSQGGRFSLALERDYGAIVKAYRAQSESLLALRGNGCVASVHVSPTMHRLAKLPEWSDYEIPIPSDIWPSDSVIWLRKGQKDVQQQLDAIVQDWHRTGWLIKVGEKYGIDPSQALLNLHEQYKEKPLGAGKASEVAVSH